MHDVAIVGGGIVGLSTALAVTRRSPRASVVVLEKEPDVARHQTGHNSGVIHSGIYYKPGSFKARFCRDGNRSMVEFCQEHGIAHEVCGKVIVATEPDELPRLDALYERGRQNGLEVRKVGPGELRELEPHVAGLAGLHVPSTGIADFVGVSHTYARLVKEAGGEVRTGVTASGIRPTARGAVVETDVGEFEAAVVVTCAGLHSDRLARRAGVEPGARIVPFRGEYYEVVPERRSLVRNLIYPVPNPDFPFLGVHFTRMIDGSVHAGPNAVLSLAREGYTKRDVDLRDLAEVLAFPGFWRLAGRNLKEGSKEVVRSFSKAAFVRSLQRLIPEVTADDVVPTHAGVRAQALTFDGGLVDDFLIVRGDRSLHVCNAPSPAATASLEIGTAVVDQLPVDLLPA